MIKSKEDLMTEVKAVIGDRTDDEALMFIEDINDTITEPPADTEDWKAKYEANDAEWRQRYRDRFFGGPDVDIPVDVDEPAEEVITFDDLFTEG